MRTLSSHLNGEYYRKPHIFRYNIRRIEERLFTYKYIIPRMGLYDKFILSPTFTATFIMTIMLFVLVFEFINKNIFIGGLFGAIIYMLLCVLIIEIVHRNSIRKYRIITARKILFLRVLKECKLYKSPMLNITPSIFLVLEESNTSDIMSNLRGVLRNSPLLYRNSHHILDYYVDLAKHYKLI